MGEICRVDQLSVIPTFAHFILLSTINPHKFISIHFEMVKRHCKKIQTSVLKLSGCFTLGAVIVCNLVFLTAYKFSFKITKSTSVEFASLIVGWLRVH